MANYSNVVYMILAIMSATIFILALIICRKTETKKKSSKGSTAEKVRILDTSGIPEAKGCKRVALLIDADNIRSLHMEKILENIALLCDSVLVYMGIYGLPSSQADWITVAEEYGMEQKFLTNYLKKKNSTDFRIVIDCMDLLHNEDIDMFVLCSSDSDFSGIAERISRDGKIAVGMGHNQTPDVFRKACTKFFLIDDKETSPEKLEQVLGNLVTFYKGKAPCYRVKPMIIQRFALDAMGYQSFEHMLYWFGYAIDDDNCVVRQHFEINKEEMHA